MRQNKVAIILMLFIFFQNSCSRDTTKPTESAIDWTLPDSRSFYMGFTAFPYDITPEAVAQSYKNQLANGDILLTHFDHGVPWEESLEGLPFPMEVQTAIDESVANSTPGHKVFLTATATDTDRDKLALYWNDSGSHQPLPDFWKNKSFNSQEVIKAYKNYCHRIIDAIQPDYFAFGIEINGAFLKNTKQYEDYLEFADNIYNSLKASYADIPILLTFQDQSFNKDNAELLQITSELMEYSDMIAVSTYPFWFYEFPKRDANPKLFSNDWLAEMRQVAPGKPFAVSETGYCAENLKLKDYGVDIKGSSEWQKEYVQKVLVESNRLNADFVIWFIYRDYDLLESKLPDPTIGLKIWKDTGLQNGMGVSRPSHGIWNTWKSLEVY